MNIFSGFYKIVKDIICRFLRNFGVCVEDELNKFNLQKKEKLRSLKKGDTSDKIVKNQLIDILNRHIIY